MFAVFKGFGTVASKGTQGASRVGQGAGRVGTRAAQISKLTAAPKALKATPKAAAKPSALAKPASKTGRLGQVATGVGTVASLGGLGVSGYHLLTDVKDLTGGGDNIEQDFSWLEDSFKTFGSDISSILGGAGQDFQSLERGVETAGSDISWGVGEIEKIAPIAIGGVALVGLLLLVR